MKNQPGIIRPPDIFYDRPTTNPTAQTIKAQVNITFITTKIEPTKNGIMRYMKGGNDVELKYPVKGWPTPENMWNCNIVKRILVSYILTIGLPSNSLAILGFLLTPWRWKLKTLNRAIKEFNHVADWILSTSYYKEEIYGPFPKELKRTIYLFLYYIGIAPEEAKAFGRIVSHLFESDDAYRYPSEDTMSETTKEKLLTNSRKEINRLINIFVERNTGKNAEDLKTDDNRGVSTKFYLTGKIISFLLILPKFKRAFKKTVQEIDITALQLDKADRYHVLLNKAHNFLGKTFEERYQEWVDIHDGNPPTAIEYKLS